jgi:hypothetical protein
MARRVNSAGRVDLVLPAARRLRRLQSPDVKAGMVAEAELEVLAPAAEGATRWALPTLQRRAPHWS